MRRVRLTVAALVLATAASVVVAGSSVAANVNIRYANNAWSPNPATAHVGDKLYFCNDSDAPISIAIESISIGPIAPSDCSKNDLTVESSDTEIGTLSYHCVEGCSANGVVMVQDAPATTVATPTTAPPPPAATATTRRPSVTTARRPTATTRRVTATSALDVTTTSEETTTTFFDTTTSELTTTTLGDFAINEERAGGDGTAILVFASLVVIASGGAYLIWRNRVRLR